MLGSESGGVWGDLARWELVKRPLLKGIDTKFLRTTERLQSEVRSPDVSVRVVGRLSK